MSEAYSSAYSSAYLFFSKDFNGSLYLNDSIIPADSYDIKRNQVSIKFSKNSYNRVRSILGKHKINSMVCSDNPQDSIKILAVSENSMMLLKNNTKFILASI